MKKFISDINPYLRRCEADDEGGNSEVMAENSDWACTSKHLHACSCLERRENREHQPMLIGSRYILYTESFKNKQKAYENVYRAAKPVVTGAHIQLFRFQRVTGWWTLKTGLELGSLSRGWKQWVVMVWVEG